MKECEIKTTMRVCAWNELTKEQRELIDIAKEQTGRAYCPYSHYHVGAALLLENGAIIRGCNQENAAYPSGLCAERSALFSAGAQYPEQPVCGACRQVMIETEHRYGKPMEVLLYGEEETYIFSCAADLLPLIFVSESLNG